MLATRQAKSLWSYNPIPYGCVLYVPLWSPDMGGAAGSVFKSPDPYGHTCTVVGATQIANGRNFDGADDYITLSSTTFESDQTGTVEFWTYPIGTAVAECVFCVDEAATTAEETFRLQFNGTTRQLSLAVYIATVLSLNCHTGGSDFSMSTWNHFTVTSDGSTLKIYTNTVLETLTILGGANTGQWFGDLTATEPDVVILGAEQRGASFISDLEGRVGELWIYNRPLSQAEITYSYNQTKGRYL